MNCVACSAEAQNIERVTQSVPTQNNLKPEGMRTLNRVGFIQLLAEASGEDTSKYTSTARPFNDTDDPAVSWAYEKWLVNGNENGQFRPEDGITCQEAAAILGRFLDYKFTALPKGCGTDAPSMDNIAEWARDGVMKCWMYGVIDTGDQRDISPLGLMSGEYGKTIIDNAVKFNVGAYSNAEQKTFADSLIHAANAKGNFTLSPYSARLCLAMLANGAKGESQKELLSALQIEDLEAFNAQVKKQMETYDSYSKIISLNTANSIWINQSQLGGKGAFFPRFAQSMKDNYRAEIEEATYKDSVERVNAWVKESTKNKIPSILNDDNRDFITALVNAVYFKAAWENEFGKSATRKAEFTNADGSKSEVDMMHQTDSFGYYSTPGVEALKMDYMKYAADNEAGDGYEYFDEADFSMYLIKADRELDVQNFLNQAEFSGGDVRVSVPKFKIEYGQSLDEALKSLGIASVYDNSKADLSAMVDTSTIPGGRLFLDTVLQKTYIAIDEKGTEAAAVTVDMMAGAALIERQPMVREFTADSPFWFAVRDNANGELLFAGRCESFAEQ